MAYVPPHKRLSGTQSVPPLAPELLVPQMKKKLNIRSDRRTDRHASTVKRIVYADHSKSRYLIVPLQDDGQIPSSIHLVLVSPESIKWKAGEKPLTLIDDHSQREYRDMKNCHPKRPWASVAGKVHSDLLSAFQNVRDEISKENLEEIKPGFVAKFGKILFHRSSSISIESLKESSISEARLRDLRRTFYTDVPILYIEHIRNVVVSKIGVYFEGIKEQYHVKLTDAMQPGSMISCKCRTQEGEKKLELYKIESNPVRHLIVDISCLDSSVDLRLALRTRRNITAVTDEEKQNISDLISSAIVDTNVKGGLRWPLGMANSGARYSVIGVWHLKNEIYSNSSMRLKVREANRYDFLSSAGDVTREIALKLTGMQRNLMEENDGTLVSTLLEGTLKLIWDHFLSWHGSLVSYCES